MIKQKLFECGNKPGKCLANLLVPKVEVLRILELKNNLQEKINSEKEKGLEFTKYYNAWYQTSNPFEVWVKQISQK